MKKWLLMFSLLLCAKVIFAQEKQAIIQVPVLSENSISRLHKQLNNYSGIHFSGYVKNASCLLIRYDSNTICDAMMVTKIIKKINKKLKCKIIVGYTAFDIIDGKLKSQQLLASGK